MVMPILLNKNDSEMLYVNHTPNELSPLGRLVNSWTALMAPNVVRLQTSTVGVTALKVKKKVDQSVSTHRENEHVLCKSHLGARYWMPVLENNAKYKRIYWSLCWDGTCFFWATFGFPLRQTLILSGHWKHWIIINKNVLSLEEQ